MEEVLTSTAARTMRRFSSHAEQEAETLRFWHKQTAQEKFKAVAEMAEHFAFAHGIDIHAQGPKRVAVRIERARS